MVPGTSRAVSWFSRDSGIWKTSEVGGERSGGYRPWAELLSRSFAVDVLTSSHCQGRMRLLAILKDPEGIARYLAAEGEPTEAPRHSPKRSPPYGKSRVLRRQAREEDAGGGDGYGGDEPA